MINDAQSQNFIEGFSENSQNEIGLMDQLDSILSPSKIKYNNNNDTTHSTPYITSKMVKSTEVVDKKR